MTKKEKTGRGPGRPPAPIERHYTVGEYTVTVTGPRDGLKFESRHNYLQFAAGDGELRENSPVSHIPTASPAAPGLDLGAIIAAAVRAAVPSTGIPSVGPGADHVLSDIGLRPGGEREDLAAGPRAIARQQLDPVAQELDNITRSVGGF